MLVRNGKSSTCTDRSAGHDCSIFYIIFSCLRGRESIKPLRQIRLLSRKSWLSVQPMIRSDFRPQLFIVPVCPRVFYVRVISKAGIRKFWRMNSLFSFHHLHFSHPFSFIYQAPCISRFQLCDLYGFNWKIMIAILRLYYLFFLPFLCCTNSYKTPSNTIVSYSIVF